MDLFQKLIKNSISRHQFVINSFNDTDIKLIELLIEKAIKTLNQQGTIFFAGNGGSFSDAQHIATELVVRYKKERKAYKAICLGTNSSSLTATSNDYSFEDIFARELDAIGQKNDLLITISTSGNSKNILKAITMAKQKQIHTFALCGKGGGEMMKQSDGIIIKSDEVARIQEGHILIGHILCEAIDQVS